MTGADPSRIIGGLPSRIWTEIDLSALRHNAREIKRAAGPGRLYMACVKGDGYGHGMVPAAFAAIEGGADRLSVARVQEAALLRESGVRVPIQVLIEPEPAAAEVLEGLDIIPTLSTPETARSLAHRIKKRIKVQVEIDTGMRRVPLRAQDAPDFLRLLDSLGKFEVEGMFSHFCSSHVPDDPDARRLTLGQLEAYLKAVESCEATGFRIPIRHMASTGALGLYPEALLDMIRPGYALYGFPIPWLRLPLRPALTWLARIGSVIDVKAGEEVGYDHAYAPTRDTRIALVSVGYADGYPRGLSNLAHVSIRGMRAPVVGLIGMDQTMVDVGGIPGVSAGDEAFLVGGPEGGGQVSAVELAEHLKSTAAMITTQITARVERRYRG